MGEYDDIINLPHHVSSKRKPMSMYQRAAQFAPFAALTGHNAAIREMARLTDKMVELDDESQNIMNKKMATVRDHLHEQPEVTITYFRPDERKEGGSYQNVTGKIRKIDDYEQVITLADGQTIPFRHIFDLQGDVFGDEE